MPTSRFVRTWLREVLISAGYTWREMKAEEAADRQREYDRLNPVHGPETQMQALVCELWADEILRQSLPVLRFEQLYYRNNLDE